MSAYKPPQDYSLVRDENDSYESEPNGIQLKPELTELIHQEDHHQLELGMSQKTGFATMQNILYCYAIAWVVALIVHVSIGPFFLMMPFLFALTVSIFLRLHIVRKYGITESPVCGECCCGFCCFSCSVAQMSRHVYGYSKLFDGDGDWERKDNYGGPALTEAIAKRLRKEERAQRRLELEAEQLKQQEAEAEAAKQAADAGNQEAALEEEAAIAKALRKEERAKRRQEAEAELLKQQEAEEQAARELEEQRRLAEEAENERVRLEEQNEESEMLKLREAEILRRRALKEQRQREAQEEQEREQAAIEEENKTLEKERLRAAEEARLAAEATNQEESAELRAKRERAEAQRKKRALFLNDMDSFSTTFESKTEAAEKQRLETLARQDEILRQQMEAKSGQFVAAKSTVQQDEEVAVARKTVAIVEEEEVVAAPTPVAAVDYTHKDSGRNKEALNTLSNSLFAANLTDDVISTASVTASTEPTETASATEEFRMPSRIGTGLGKSAKSAKAGPTSPTTTSAANAPAPAKEETFYRIEDNSHTTALMASMLAASAAAAPVSSKSKKVASPSAPVVSASSSARGRTKSELEVEDDEEEGTGDLSSISNILSKEERRAMTAQQKANWRAKQTDLAVRRKDFHGVVTYTFDGIFSWQMYGSAEASDENGNPYTEYLMRCQWGTTFENLQPWIVAHRYKEFDALDVKLKKLFPTFEKNMPSLPKKDLFRYLDSTVIAQRRSILEDYMSKVVVSMPTILRSEIMNDFLNITERIASIRLKLNLNQTHTSYTSSGLANPNCQASFDDMLSPRLIPPGTDNELFLPVANKESPLPLPNNSSSNSKGFSSSSSSSSGSSSSAMDDPFGVGNVTTKKTGTHFHKSAAEEVEEEDQTNQVLYLTVDTADAAKESLNSRSLDEDALGHLEEDIKALGIALSGQPAKELLPLKSKFRTLLLSVASRWPNLRATCVVGMGVDFSLIPRAMQAEEDLVRHVDNFKSLEAAARA
eukprot:gene22430-28555_t